MEHEKYHIEKLSEPVGYLIHKYTHSCIAVYEPIGWFKAKLLAWCFGLKYEKAN